jgi:protein-S-isoprenylcysteine O-methyltransferase Ste14
MRATAVEFRLRWFFILAIVLLGFWAPWIDAWGIGRHTPLLEWLALELSRLGLLSFTQATPVVIVLASLIAAVSAVLRIWGSAYLDPIVVGNAEMKAGRANAVVAAGPFRYLRNPLYVGTWFLIAAMAFAMPVTGALVTMALLTVFLLRLILGEEAFLANKLGEPYEAYRKAVPRLVPLLRSKLDKSEARPVWLHAALTELTSIGIFLVMAVLSWRYDNALMLKGILISFLVALAMRGLMRRPVPTAIALVCLGLLVEAAKLPWYRAALISFGIWLVLRAVLTSPQKVVAEK